MKALLKKLDVETFILDLVPDSRVEHLEGVKWVQLDDHTLEVDVHKDTGLNTVFEQLSAQGIKVLSMRNKANRLEELFVTLIRENAEAKA